MENQNFDLQILESINRKMNVIISLLMLTQKDNGFNADVEKISKLKEWGLTNDEIGQIMNRSATQVSKQVYKSKKRSK